MAEIGLSGSKGEEQSRELDRYRAFVPEQLQPLLDTFLGAQRGLTDSVATKAKYARLPGLTPDQIKAEDMARSFATGQEGTIPFVQNYLRDVAGGSSLEDVADPTALNSIRNSIGRGAESLLPGGSYDAITGIARGDQLFGGDAFDQSVKAAVDAALPGISSAFGGTRGGLSGALAKEAVGNAGMREAFRYQDNAANRQLAAAGLLGDLGGQTNQLATNLLGLSTDYGDRAANRGMTAASALPGLSMLGPEVLSQYGGTRRDLSERRQRYPLEAQLAALQGVQGNFPWAKLLGYDRETTGDSSKQEAGKGIGFGGE